MANRAQRRKAARQAPPAQRGAENTRAEEERIKRLVRQMQAETPQGGLAGMRAEAETELLRKVQARELVVNALEKNGITLQDLEKEYERGRQDGYMSAGTETLQCCYAGICIALHDAFGFGEERCYRALKACEEKIIYVLNHAEMAGELLEKTGLILDWGDPFDRVRKRD